MVDAMASDVLTSEQLSDLTARVRGELVTPDAPSYDEHRRIWNGSIDRSPALIARCAGVADVIDAVKFARGSGLPTAVRSGGHSFPGQSVVDDGIVIDLSLMQGVRVDLDKATVRAQAGVRLGDLDRETQAFGLAVPSGIVTHTGMAGLTLGGGIGWLMRKWGLTIDQLLSVDVVTADGELIKASADENADLFWGMRGAGSNFGIVTEFEFRLNPLGPVILGGPMMWPIEQSAEVLRHYRDWIADAPDELTTIVVHRKLPSGPPAPPDLYGRPVVIVAVCYAGSVEDGERVVRPMREFGEPLVDLCIPRPFLSLQAMFDASFPTGWWYYFRSCDVQTLSDEVIDITAEHAQLIPGPLTAFPIFQLGGAISRVGEEDTAYNNRSAGHRFNINATTLTREGFDTEVEWARTFWQALAPYHSSVYVNFLMDEGAERIRQAYGDAKFERLQALKTRYDPDNFFRLNQNIPPA